MPPNSSDLRPPSDSFSAYSEQSLASTGNSGIETSGSMSQEFRYGI